MLRFLRPQTPALMANPSTDRHPSPPTAARPTDSERYDTLPRHLPRRFWIEAIMASLGLALLVLTLVSHTWFERLTGVEPDGGDGSLEFALPLALLAVSAVSAVAARRHYVRAARA